MADSVNDSLERTAKWLEENGCDERASEVRSLKDRGEEETLDLDQLREASDYLMASQWPNDLPYDPATYAADSLPSLLKEIDRLRIETARLEIIEARAVEQVERYKACDDAEVESAYQTAVFILEGPEEPER